MNRFTTLLLILLLFTSLQIVAQQKHSISGYVREKESRELLPGVNIYLPELRTGTTTNNYGFYSITLPEGKYELRYSFIGYQTVIIETDLIVDRVLDINLDPSINLMEVEILSDKAERISESSRISMISMPVNQIKNIPALLGEKDVFKALQLMPGVQKGSEGNSGIYVRGGGPDQNLIILDDAPVYNASHLFGFFSIFNGDALKSIELTKGGFPARYGGRLSSVIEMTMKDGNKQKFSGEAGIGLISSRLVLEGPIKKDTASFLISARRTYVDMLMKPFMSNEGRAGYYFYDLNAKLNYDFSPKNKIYLSGYFGRDKFNVTTQEYYDSNDNYKSKAGLYWQNATGTLRWNHLFSNRIFSNTSLIFSRYNLKIYQIDESSSGDYSLEYESGIRDFALKYDLEYHVSALYTLRAGVQTTNHLFTPSAIVEKDDQAVYEYKSETKYDSFETGLYVENNFNFSGKVQLNAGLRFSHFIADKKNYFSPEPRLSVNYLIREGISAKIAYAEMNQYIHLLSSTGVGLPTDLWVPSTDRVAPQNSRQISGGFAKDLPAYNLTLTLEGYYKWSNNILGYKPGASFLLLDDPTEAQNFTWQDNVTAGSGTSYGAEFLIHRKTGKFSGWIGYTLSWTKLQFDEINFGKEFWARYDRRHDLSLVGIYTINKRTTLSGTWVYGTGNAITLPLGEYPAEQHQPFAGMMTSSVFNPWNYSTVTDYGEVNSFRMKAYHRFDISIQFHKQKKHFKRTWEIGLYNSYSRKNPYFYFVESQYENDQVVSKLKQVSIFPIIPSINYNIKF
ncbi:MAG: TonB-dependent receptor [Bacteroidales bacterium]|nr:TonB-dependent receptor [Bacteroidales bacterium]